MKKYPCTYMRGGTSKAIFFLESDLPEDKRLWPELFLKVMGSPDIKQIDGMGGGTSSTSKVAVISKSDLDGVDVNYNFFQVDILIANVDNTANCGNIAAAVGPFAIETGLVSAVEPQTTVRILNNNTGKIIENVVEVKDGEVCTSGTMRVEGVPGTAAPINVVFLDPAGSKTGALFPTGQRKEVFEHPDYDPVTVTLIDCANPVLFLNAADLGIQGCELTDLTQNKTVMNKVEALRGLAAEKLGFVAHWSEAATKSTSIPKVSIISAPQNYYNLDGKENYAEEMDLCVRAISLAMVHKAIPLTVAAATSAAACLTGTIVNDIISLDDVQENIRLGHASGVTTVNAQVENDDSVVRAGVMRTARRIMDGFVYVEEK